MGFQVGSRVRTCKQGTTPNSKYYDIHPDFQELEGTVVAIPLLEDILFVKFDRPPVGFNYLPDLSIDCRREFLTLIEDYPHVSLLKNIHEGKHWKVPYSKLETLINDGYVNPTGVRLTESGKKMI